MLPSTHHRVINMAPWPPDKCAACGNMNADIMLAIVSDPFADTCYGLCQKCLNKAFKKDK